MCDNSTGPVDDDSVWDEHPGYKDEGWGYKRENDPDCYAPEYIKEFIEGFEPVVELFAN